jgi:hypothetical protein
VKALRDAAAWFDEEYRLETMVPFDRAHPESYAMIALGERRAILGQIAALLRQWAETGTEPKHRAVKEQWRADHEALCKAAGPLGGAE